MLAREIVSGIKKTGLKQGLLKWYKPVILFAALFSSFGFQANKFAIRKWVIINGCTLKVDGKTNINTFSCAISNYNKPDTIIARDNNNHSLQLQGKIQLDVQQFDCHHPIMTADLRKTLKAKQYPKLIVTFLSMDTYPDSRKGNEITKGMVSIELAGVAKVFEVNYRVVAADPDYLNFEGSRKLTFTDFNLTPPRKLGGMIRTENELIVVFNLKMKVIH